MIRTAKDRILDLTTGRVYALKFGQIAQYVFCDDQRITDETTTAEVWEHLAGMCHKDFTADEPMKPRKLPPEPIPKPNVK